MSGEAHAPDFTEKWPAEPSSSHNSPPRVVVFLAGPRARLESTVHQARSLFPGRRLLYVCEPEQRAWVGGSPNESIHVVKQPFNPFAAQANDFRKILEMGPIEVCAVAIGDTGFENFRFRLFALRLRPSRFILLGGSDGEATKEMGKCPFALAVSATLVLRMCSMVAGWIAPLDQPLAVGLAWLARIVAQFNFLPAANAGKEIVHLLPNIGIGGVQRQVVLLLKNRSPAFNHRVIVMWSDDRFFAPELAASGVPVQYLNSDAVGATFSKSISRRGMLLTLRPVFRIFRDAFPFCWEIIKLTLFLRALKPPPDIVHCWLLVANLAGSIAARLAGVRQVATSVRNIQSAVEFNYYNPRWQRILERATVPLADVITANAPAVAADYQKFTGAPAKKIITVPNGVDIAAFRVLTQREREEKRWGLGLKPNDLVVGTVARLAKEKDFETFLRAIALARGTLPALRCLIVGDGPLRFPLEAYCESIALSASVTFLGERKDVGDLIQCYDVFLLTSVIEGMPNAVMESQLLGTPVVATRAGGSVDLIQHGETGLLAPIGDAEALGSHLVRVLTDDELRNRIKRTASEQIRNGYTVEQFVARTESIYQTLLHGGLGVENHSCAA